MKKQKKNLSLAATGRVLTEDKKKISLRRKGIKLSENTRKKIALTVSNLIGVKVEVKNIITNEEFEFKTLTDAAKKLDVSRTSIKKALDNKKLIKGQYQIS